MEPVLDFGLQVTRWLQQTYPWLRGLMTTITTLGGLNLYLLILPLIYWCIDKQLGRYLTYLLTFGALLSEGSKGLLRSPRPSWLDEALGLAQGRGYGGPSGHTSTAVVFYITLAGWVRRRWVWFIAILMPLLIALSRVFLGVHFLHDVVAGLLLGFLIVIISLIWRRWGQSKFANRIMGQKLLLAVAVPLAAAGLYAIGLLLIGNPNLGVSWSAQVDAAEREALENVISGSAALLGLGIGFVLEGNWIRYRVGGSLSLRAARYIVGIVGLATILFGLRALFPIDPLFVALPLRFLRYLLAALWLAYYAPILFVRLGLAKADPNPGIQVGMRRKLLNKRD